MAKAVDPQTVSAVRRAYFQPWTYSCPVIGNIEEADCIWAFAFGRNSFPDADLGNIISSIRSKSAHNDRDSYLSLDLKRFEAGKPNEQIGRYCLKQVYGAAQQKRRLQVIAQWEIPAGLYCSELSEKFSGYDKQGYVIPFWPPEDKPYFNSLDGMQECIQISKRLGCKRPAIVAHDAMRVRVLLIAWKLGINAIVPEQHISDFDPDSIQPHTRNKKAWLPREIVARYVHHPLKGFVSFSPPSL